MDIRKITETYAVSPQIAVEDVPALKDAGIRRVICNRPDVEVPPGQDSDTIGAAVREAGLEFEVLELTHQTMTPENVARQAALIAEADGPVLAYCASGTRSSVVWALGAARERSPDAILQDVARAGYDLGALRPRLEEINGRKG